MKTKKLSIAIALLAVAVIGTSCGNKQQKSSSDTTTEQTTSSALEIDSLLANAENLAGKEVTIEGVCTHTCKHGAKKIFLMGSDDTQVIRGEESTRRDSQHARSPYRRLPREDSRPKSKQRQRVSVFLFHGS